MTPKARPFRPRVGRARRGAFTFIEILATMALLGIVLPAVMSGISLCLATADVAKRQAQASALGHDKLMELVAEENWQQGAVSGDFGQDWPEYRWTAQVADWDGGALRELDVTVLWQQRSRQRSVTMSTLVSTGSQP